MHTLASVMAAYTEMANTPSEYSRWIIVHGKLSDHEHSEIKNSNVFHVYSNTTQ